MLSVISLTLCGVTMPVLEGLWSPDLRLRDSGLGVGVDVGVCPDEAPSSSVWDQLRTPPVTCGGLSLALELPALIRQLRAAWRARRGGPRGPERSQTTAWVEAEKEEVEEVQEHDTEDRSTHLEGISYYMVTRTIKLVGFRFLVNFE